MSEKKEIISGGDTVKKEIVSGDDIVKKEIVSGDDIVKKEIVSGDDIVKKKIVSGDDIVKKEIASHDDRVKKEIVSGDDIVKKEIVSGDDIVKKEIVSGDDTIKKEIVSSDDTVKKEIDSDADTLLQNTLEDTPPEAVTNAQNVKHENGSLDGSVKIQDKVPQHPHFMSTRRMMPGLPPIDLNQLTTILRDPSMPSQEIMKEVADKMMLRCEESESDDNSTGGLVGMQGLLDCIFEVTIQRPDSDNSDDESFQRISREIPCSICNKIFGSTMRWKTHVLVAHQDPSVLNIRRLPSSEGDRKEKCTTTHRRHSRNTSKPDTGATDNKIRYLSKTDSKQNTEVLCKKENVAENQRQSLIVRPLQSAKPVSLSDKHHMGRQSRAGNKDTCSSESEQECKDIHVGTYQVKDCINSIVNAGLLQIPESTHRNIDSAEVKEANAPGEVHNEPQTFEQGPNVIPFNQTMLEREQKEHSSMPDKSATIDIKSGEDSVHERKRKATSLVQESASTSLSSSQPPSSHSKRSRKHPVEDLVSSSTQELE